MSTTISVITQTNSTTYADETGVLIGLSRLPGETSEAYVKRLKNATRIDTGQDYIGLLNEITLQLGLNISQSISLVSALPGWAASTNYVVGTFILDSNGNVEEVTAITGSGTSGATQPAWNTTTSGTTTDNQITWTNLGTDIISVNCNLAGIVLTDTITTATQTIPIVVVDIDDAWTWTMLSNIVATINTGGIATATLLVDDAPSMTIASQSNTITVIAQPINGQNVILGHNNIVAGSEVFNVAVPTYTLSPNGVLVFSSPVPSGTQITYQYVVFPYNIITGDVGLLSLLDPAVGQMAQGPNGTMVYQVQEAIQAIAQQDQSYWGA